MAFKSAINNRHKDIFNVYANSSDMRNMNFSSKENNN